MTFRNTTRSWGFLSKALHWLIVLLILNQWIIAERAHSLPKGPALIQALWWHKSFGITILMLAVIRLAWRLMNPVPDLRAETRPWERVLARVSHVLLYALIFAMPLSGWMMSSARNFPVSWFGWVQLPDLVGADPRLYERLNDLHELLFKVLVAVAALHAAGALKHHFIDRNDVLRRMLPFGRTHD
ncbi:MAG TPA: cytochrome b [Steroidobacteraceae bacterium]|jgi:cytochrome b561|nr:cytochrome b [Steroidobacteraceae bacterium]